MTSKPIRLGVVGAGGIALHYHVPSCKRAGGVQFVAACDVSPTALKAMREACGVERTYKDYKEMFAREELDLVSVCTSNDMHYPVVMAAIERGFDIYCEKPLAMTVAQAKEMYEAAQAKGIKTGVNFSHRRTPAARLAHEIVQSGALGQITYVAAVYAAGGVDYANRPGSWRNDASKAGYGGLGDMGSHMMDMMRWWLGADVTAVAAQMKTFVPERPGRDGGSPTKVTTEDQGTMLVNWSIGAMGYFCGTYIFTGRGYDQRVEIYGANGGLMYNQQRPFELDVYLPAEALKRYQVLRQGGTPDTPYTTILVPERLREPAPDGQGRSVMMDFLDAYRAEGPFTYSPGFYEGLKVQEILEATRRAAQTGCWVTL